MAANNKAMKEAVAEARAKRQAQVQAKQDKQRKRRELARAAHKNVNQQIRDMQCQANIQVAQPPSRDAKHHKAPTNEAKTAPKPSASAGAETEVPPSEARAPTSPDITGTATDGTPSVELTVAGKRAAPSSPPSDHSTSHMSKWQHTVDANTPTPAMLLLPVSKPTAAASTLSTLKANKDATSRPRRQLPLSAFYTPQSLADAQAQLEQEVAIRQLKPVEHWTEKFPSSVLDKLLDSLQSPRTVVAWRTAFDARIIAVPGNGGCLYYAVHGCRARRVAGTTMSVCGTHNREGNFYKLHVCQVLGEYLDPMIAAGTITLADMNRRFFDLRPPADRAAALKAVRAFIASVRDVDIGKGLTRDQWGGDEELFALVWYLRDPLFVLAEDDDGVASMRVVRIDRLTAKSPESIAEHFLALDDAYDMLRTFLRHRSIPTVLVYSPNGGNGHFNSFRFNESLYVDWTNNDHEGLAMRARMDQAVVSLGWYVPPSTPQGIPKFAAGDKENRPLDVTLSGSLCEPSGSATSMEEDDSSSPLTSPSAMYALLSSLNSRRRRRGAQAKRWERADRANLEAYRMWAGEQLDDGDREEVDTVSAGCRYWSSSIDQLVALLRALPYLEVAIALLPSDIIQRLGNELDARSNGSSTPSFIVSDDREQARREWARLVALVVVVSDDSLSDLQSVEWLHAHPVESVAALHDLRLYDRTVIGRLAIASGKAQPTRLAERQGGARS